MADEPSAGTGPGASVADATTAGTGPGRFRYAVPPVTLVDSTGTAIRLDRLLDTPDPVALQFIFTTCPGVCPTLTATLAALGRRVPEARLVSISIDPEVDTPARLAEYKKHFGATEGWRFLTGTSAASIAAQQAFDSYRGEKMRHQPSTFLKQAGGKSWLRFEGFSTVDELAATLAAPPPGVELGRRLYQQGLLASGLAVEVEIPTGGVLSGKAAACAGCHRPSGYGGVEGGLYLPPVTGPYLFGGRVNRRIDLFHELFQEELASEVWARLRQRPDRPAYTAESLGAALATGHDPTGRAFDPRMPRYELSAEDLSHLSAYLATLGAASGPGVDAESIRFVTVVEGPADTPEERARLAVLEAFLRLKNADTGRLKQRPPDPLGHEEHFAPAYRRWQLEVVSLDFEAPDWPRTLAADFRARPPFALLAGPGGEAGRQLASFCEERALPCLLLEEEPRAEKNGEEMPRLEAVRRVGAASCPEGAPEGSTEPPQAFRARQWLRARGIPAGSGESTALATHHLLSVAEAALMLLVDDFSPAYFLESFDREVGRMPSPLACGTTPAR